VHTACICLVSVAVVIIAASKLHIDKWTRNASTSLHKVACSNQLPAVSISQQVQLAKVVDKYWWNFWRGAMCD